MSELPRLSYSGAEALKALAATAIDPGELTREELSSRIQVPLGSGLSKVVNRLVHDGLVTEDGDARRSHGPGRGLLPRQGLPMRGANVMRITAFLEAEHGEPVIVDHDAELVVGSETYALDELVDDLTNCSLDDIDVVSANVATIATHALHGVLRATHPDSGISASGRAARAARAWALAALRELAFYDRDVIDIDIEPEGDFSQAGGGQRVADPGREAVDAIRCGARLVGQPPSFCVEWPDG